MNFKDAEKLTTAEAKNLEQYVTAHGGQVKICGFFGVSPTTLSRTVNQRTAPNPTFRKKLSEIGVVAA